MNWITVGIFLLLELGDQTIFLWGRYGWGIYVVCGGCAVGQGCGAVRCLYCVQDGEED